MYTSFEDFTKNSSIAYWKFMGADKYLNKLYLQTDLICAQGGLKGLKKVRQTPRTFGRGHGASI